MQPRECPFFSNTVNGPFGVALYVYLKKVSEAKVLLDLRLVSNSFDLFKTTMMLPLLTRPR